MVEALTGVPEPSFDDLDWFDQRRVSTESILPLEEALVADRLTFVQRKMITVLARTTWTHCDCESTYGEGRYTIHGRYDPVQRGIVLYATACRAGDIYATNLRDGALLLRYWFVAAHELAHAVDHLSGRLQPGSGQSEQRANVFGLLITQCFARLFARTITIYHQLVVQHPELEARDDRRFMEYILNRWCGMERLFVDLATAAEHSEPDSTGTWVIAGCLERRTE